MPGSLIALCVVLLIALGIIAALKTKAGRSATGFPYLADKALFTPAERSFLGVLDQAVGKEYRVFGKVRIADVLSVRRGGGHSAFSRIGAKHFDFLLCRPDDLRPVCAIELNDMSHRQEKRQQRDDFLSSACQAAGLPLLMIPAQRGYSASELLAQIHSALPAKAIPAEEALQKLPPAPVSPEPTPPTCPRCASAMVKRTAKGGEREGHEFWGCSNFPACRGILAIGRP